MKNKLFKNKISIFKVVLFTLLLLYVVSLVVPLIWGVSTSLKNYYLDFRNNVIGFPNFSAWAKSGEAWYSNYLTVIENFNKEFRSSYYAGFKSNILVTHTSNITIWTALLNTLLYAGVVSVIIAIVPCVVGYLCAKYKNTFSKIIYATVVVTMTLPLFGQAPSLITFLRQINLYDNFLGQWLSWASFANLYFLVFFAFFEGLSDAYIEAAEIDGASQFSVLIKIAIPLAKNTILTVTLIVFVNLWNDYNAPLLYLPTKPTLAYAIFNLQQHSPKIKGQVTLQVTSLMLLALPVLILFVIFKDKFMGNISLGGVKE